MAKISKKQKIETLKEIRNLLFDHLKEMNNRRLNLWIFSLGISIGLIGGVLGNFLHNIFLLIVPKYYIIIFIVISIAFMLFGLLILREYNKSNKGVNEAYEIYSKIENLYRKEITKK